MIQSKEDAARAIKEVCEWIKTQPTHPLDELSDPNQRSVVVFFVNGHGLCEGWTRQENQHVS